MTIKMFNILMILWIILMSLILSGQCESVIYDTANSEFDNCSSFMCEKPQRELFRLEDIVDTNDEGEVAYKNRPIVLKRCRPNTGCCPTTDQVCTYDTKVRNVTVLFNFRNHSHWVEQKRCITVPDDLECVCKKISKMGPERREKYEISRDCPFPKT